MPALGSFLQIDDFTQCFPRFKPSICSNLDILVLAFGGTALTFGCFSAAAVGAKQREFLYLGGLLSSALSILMWLRFASSIFGSTGTFSFEMNFYIAVHIAERWCVMDVKVHHMKRIPCQEKQMFGFVSFHYSETYQRDIHITCAAHVFWLSFTRRKRGCMTECSCANWTNTTTVAVF